MSQILHSNIIGEGKPLFILHGFLGMSDNWKTLGKQYAANGFQVHLIDQRNHGRSFHSPNFDYDILSKDIFEYLKHHELSSISIIGHSMGGKTAMQFACDHAHLCHKLLIADIAPKYYPPHHHEIIDGLNALNFDQIATRTEADNVLSNYVKHSGTRQFLLKNLYWVEKGKLGFRCNLDVLSSKMEEIGENISATASFTGSTLFLKGDRSEYIVGNDTDMIKRHFPEAQIETISNAGHWLHAENPSEYLEKSMNFLNY